MALIAALDTSDSVREAIARYAEICEATPADVADQALAFVREGPAKAVLVAAGSSSASPAACDAHA